MEELKRIVEIIANNNPKVLPIVDQGDESSLEGRLFQLVKGNDKLTDEDACLQLYGEYRLMPSYRMLKSRLRKKLLNSLLFTELAGQYFRESTTLYSECSSLLLQAHKLVSLSEPFMAEKIADQVIALAKKAELNDILVRAYEIKQSADLVSGNRSKFEKNYKLLEQYNYLDTVEREAILIYNKLKFEINLNLSNHRKQAAAYKNTLPRLQDLWESSGSSKIYDYYHMMRISYKELIGDYDGVLEAIEEAERLLADSALNKLWFNNRFNNYIKVYAYLRLGKLDDGLLCSEKYLDNFREGSNNWIAFMENYVILALHKRDYHLAEQLCLQAYNNGVFKNIKSGVKERWWIFIRYTRLISPQIQSDEFDSIHLHYEFDASVISKDKEGFNLPLLILEYLESLPRLDAEDRAQYAARFSKYTSKYLKDKAAARARIFIKLLLLSMKEDGEKLEQKAAPVLEELKNTPPPRDPIAEVEIVPYEHLWELVLDLVKQRVKQ